MPGFPPHRGRDPAARGRHEVARLDRQTPARCQLRILLGLVHKARATTFGRQHDFHRIRTEADFRRLVPLRSPAELERLQPTPGAGKRAHREAFHAAWRTALAFVGGARPHGRLLSGQLIFLGDGGLFDRAALPRLVRPYGLMGCGAATPELLARTPVTCLAGSAEGIDSLLTGVKAFTGCDRLSELWPGLTAVLHTRRSAADEPAPRFRESLGDRVLLLETRFLPGGPVAVEDPRRGCPLLLFDHGVYFEFTPAEEAGEPAPTRHGLGEVEPGVAYEMVMSSPAGVWACRTGMAVRFERRDPPLLRFVETPAAAPARRVVVIRPACPAQAPHRQIAGTPAAPPEKLVHTPWSTPSDRG